MRTSNILHNRLSAIQRQEFQTSRRQELLNRLTQKTGKIYTSKQIAPIERSETSSETPTPLPQKTLNTQIKI